MLTPVHLDHAAAIRGLCDLKLKTLALATGFESSLADPHIHHLPEATRHLLEEALAAIYKAATLLHEAENHCWSRPAASAS